jgi:predicted permease
VNALGRPARVAVRNLGQAPGFTISVGLASATGIGLGTPILAVVRAALLRSAPYTHPLLPDDATATEWMPAWTPARQTIAEIQTDALQPLLWVLLALTLLLLAIALIDVLTLILTRGAVRRPEMALRVAIGAVQRRLVGQLLVEGAPLLLLAGAAGIGLGVAVSFALHTSWPEGAPPWDRFGAGGWIFGGTLGIFLLLPLMAWLTPASVGWSRDLRRFLTTGARSTDGRREVYARQVLAVVQIASLLVLLTSAGLLLLGIGAAADEGTGLGFDPRDTLTVQLRIPEAHGLSAKARQTVQESVRERIVGSPGVVDTSLSTLGTWLGLGTTDRVAAFCMECFVGTVPRQINRGPARISAVSPGFFKALGTPLTRGREFEQRDGIGSAYVAIISRTFAYRLFPNGEPLGKQVLLGGNGGAWYTVVGIVDDIHASGIGSASVPAPTLYLSALQFPPTVMDLAVRTSGDPMLALAVVESAVHAVVPDAVLTEAMTMEEYLARYRAPLRWFAVLFGVLAGVALLLATAGLQSVMAYNVARRTREIGVRMVMGAQIRDVTRMIVGQSLRITGIGVVFGLIGALSLARLLQILLNGITVFDPLLFGGIAVLLGGISLLASYRPARRAAAIDPQVSLRAE